MSSASPAPSANNSEFAVRVRQAIRSAKNSLPQVAVLVFSFDSTINRLCLHGNELLGFQNRVLMRLRRGLRESDSVALLDSGHAGVLLQAVQGPQDLDLVINRLLARLDEPLQINNASVALEPSIGSALFPED